VTQQSLGSFDGADDDRDGQARLSAFAGGSV
jgi:hypothetical protein